MLRKTIAAVFTHQFSLFLKKGGWLAQFALSMLLTTLALSVQANGWKSLSPGIEYRDLGASYLTPWTHIHVFRIDLRDNMLDLVMANQLSQPHASADEFAQYSKALLTINGGFFDRNYRPLGLRISHKNRYSPLKNISWWGIFYIQNNHAHIKGVQQFTANSSIDFAVQSGPRLLINGQIPALKVGRAERSALGITYDKKVIIVVTENANMTTTELATIMKSPLINCKNALNLDGGNSSQLHAQINSFQLNVHGFSHVSDAIIVKPRK